MANEGHFGLAVLHFLLCSSVLLLEVGGGKVRIAAFARGVVEEGGLVG